MNNAPSSLSSHFLLVAVIAAFCAGCADDAAHMDRAREFRDNAEYRAATIELKNVLRSDPDNAEARAMLGEVSLRNGDSATAIKELRRARELGGAPDQYAVTLARALLRESRFQEVVKLNTESLTEIGNRAALLALIGTAELRLGNQDAAQEKFLAALELVPDQPDALLGNSTLARERGDLSAAESGLEQMLQSRPDDADGLAALARLQQDKGEFAQAEENYNKALKAVAGTGRAHERMLYMSGLMDALLSQGKNSRAVAVGSNMMQMSSQHPLALFQAARADYASANYSGAIEKAERIISVHPTAEPPRMLLAGAAFAKGDTALAATHLQVAVDSNPANEPARRLLATVRMKMDDPDEALALLEPLIAAGTEDTQLLAMAGTANLRSGNQEAGLELVERGMEIASDDPAVAMQAAQSFLAAGEVDRAIEVLESLPEDAKTDQRDLLLVLALLRKGDKEAARATAMSVVDAHPELSESHRLMGSFHLAVGEFDQARSEFEKTLELNPGDLGAVVNLFRLDIAQQKPEQAKARLRAVLDADPGNLVALTGLAKLAGVDTEEGVALLEQAREGNPDVAGPALELGRYYLRAGKLQLAEERANQAVRIAPSNGDTHVLLGQVLLQDGRASEAIVPLEKAVEVAPRLVLAHFTLGRAQAASGQKEASFDSYQRAADIDQTFFPARAALTGAAIERGDLSKAMSVAESLISDYPQRAEPLMLKAQVLLKRNDLQGALDTYREAALILPSREIAVRVYQIQKSKGVDQPWDELAQWVADHPDDAMARTMLATAYKETGTNDLAIDNYEQVMATEPDVRVAMALADLEESGGDLDAAAGWLKKAVALAPTEIPARAALAGLELKRGNTDSATRLLRELRKDHPNEPQLDVLEGDILLAAGDYKGSIAALDNALKVRPSEYVALKRYHAGKASGDEDAWKVLESWFSDHPGHINAGLQLAQDFSERDWNDEAIDVYRKVLATEPNNVIALNNIAWAYLERGGDGDLQSGLTAASKAYGQGPQMAAIADTYGWILMQDGQNRRAVDILRVAASSADADAEIIYHLAVALDAMGNNAEAITALDRALGSDKPFASREDAEVLRRRLSP